MDADNYYLELKEKIKLHLVEYLEEHQPEQYTFNGQDANFKCVLHSPDNNPSMYVGHTVPHLATCRTCATSINIFNFHGIYENAPMHGRDFIENNLNVLAVKYGYDPLEMTELTEDQLHKIKIYDIHDAAYEILRSDTRPNLVSRKYNNLMSITDNISSEMGIGTILNYDKFIEEIQKLGGWSEEEVLSADIRRNMYGPTMLTYAIHNASGRCIAFMSRDWRYDGRFGVPKEQEYTDKKGNIRRRPKWNNSSTSIIYEKSTNLYGFHRARKHNYDSKIYIVEGQADVITLLCNGIENVACISGTSFSLEHIKLIKSIDKSVVIICLDNDQAGWKATDRVLEDGFKDMQFVKAQILLIPETPREDGKIDVDPDTYVKAHGKDAFLNLKPLTAFEYTVKRIPDTFESDDEKDFFVKRFIPIIMNETSAITQQMMRQAVAAKINVKETLIREYQSNLEHVQNSARRERLKKANVKAYRQMEEALNFDPEKAMSVSSSFSNLVKETMDVQYTMKMGLQEVLDGFSAWKEEREKADVGDLFWKTGWNFWDEHLGGIQKTDTFIGFSGASNFGKSTLLTNVCMGLLQNNPLDKLIVMYYTIDDTKETLYTKLVAVLSKLEIYKVFTASNQPPEVQAVITKNISVLEKFVKNQNLLVKGSAIGKGAEDVMKWVKITQEKFPNKKVVLLVDSFSNMTGPGEELQVQEHNINILHEMRCSMDMSILSTFEMNKEASEGRSTGKGIRGTAKIFYRLTRNLTIFNDHKSCEQKQNSNPEIYWENDKGVKRPVLEACLGKSKNMTPGGGGVAGDNMLYFQYEPDIGCLFEIGSQNKFTSFQQENNVQRQHTTLGLPAWKSTTSTVDPNVTNASTSSQLTTVSTNQNTTPKRLQIDDTMDDDGL